VNWIDAWVIRNVSGLAAVGVYSWAYQTTAIASLVFAPMAVALTPRVIDARLNDDRARLERYTGSILPAALVCAAAVAASFVLVFPAIRALTSPAYADAYPVVLVLLAALPFQLTAHLVTPLASAYERLIPRFVMVSVFIAVVNVAGDLLLVRHFGIIGAAVATATAFAAGALVLVTVVRAEGLAFAPLWHYAAPGLVVFPAAALMYFAGPVVGSAVIVVAGAVALAIVALAHKRRAVAGAPAGLLAALAALGLALTLDDATRAGNPDGVSYPAAPRAIES
jgi:O-antigen/teichoic acid export membrane protein